jgi:Abnormal spindle-like microcephaly-assoc'd, ASPM-SPD-2-Hydin
MYYRHLFYRSINLNNRAMKSPRITTRSLLIAAWIAILLLPTARATDALASKSTSYHARTRSLVFTPRNLHFGSVRVGRQVARAVTVTNTGDSNVRLLQVTTQGTEFTLNGLDLPLTLAGGESFTFSAVFAPRSPGARNGSISFSSEVSGVSDFSNPIVSLELNGVGDDSNQLIVDPANMNFGTVLDGSGGTQGGTLTAAATQVTIASVNISNPAFTLSGLSFPLTIPASGSQGFQITFSPETNGVASGTVSFLDGSGNPLVVESLYGVGTVSQGHSVDLSWNASTSQNVIGYNVYRGTQSGGPYTQINPVLDASTIYTDTSVADGETYYYVTTAVNSDDQESVYSNQAQATIPGDQVGNTERTQRTNRSPRISHPHSVR